MFENWFTNKCTAFVNNSGRMLDGAEKEAAESAVKNAEAENMKVWTDKDGAIYVKKRSLFASAEQLRDVNGNLVRICNHRVNTQARFCSKCGAPAPGGWWKCSGCGEYIGNDSTSCPHCGKVQSLEVRQNFSNGMWLKDEDVIAEFIDLEDVALKLKNGLSVLVNQCCVFLAGGKIVEVLEAGSYSDEQLKAMAAPYGGNRGVIMIDRAEFPVSVNVEKIRSKEDMLSDLHITLTLRLDSLNVNQFLQNFISGGLTLAKGSFSSVVTYDEIARNVQQFSDALAREFCVSKEIKELFCNAETRKGIEEYIETELFSHLKSAGMTLVRLGEVEFESEVFERLRETSGDIEVKRRELEFMTRINELTYDTRKQELLSESQMEDLVREFAKDKKIKEELLAEEMEQLQKNRALKKAILEVEQKCDIEDALLKRESQSRLHKLKIELEEQQALHSKQLELRRMEQETTVAGIRFDDQLADLRKEIELKDLDHNIEVQNKQIDQMQKIEQQETEHAIKLQRMKLAAELEMKKSAADMRRELEREKVFSDNELRKHSAYTDLDIKLKEDEVLFSSKKAALLLNAEEKERENKIELDRLEKLMALRNMKNNNNHQRNIELLQAADGADTAALLRATDDPVLRKQLLELHAMRQQESMTPEKILANAAAQGNRDAAEALLALLGREKKNGNGQ